MKRDKTDIWMPLYWGAYKKNTAHLSAAQHGAYLLLIGHYWVTAKPLPKDERQLMRIAAMTAREWRASREIILSFFVDDGSVYRNATCDGLLAKAVENVKRQRARTASATEARWLRNGDRNGSHNGKRYDVLRTVEGEVPTREKVLVSSDVEEEDGGAWS